MTRHDVSINNMKKRRKQVDGKWPCYKCKQYKESYMFGKISYSWNGIDSICKECRSHKRKSLSERENIWELCVKKRYGVSKEEFYNLLDEQNGVCAICFKCNSAGRKLNVDHSHETGKVRGLLCANCNTAIGLLKDDKELLVNALNYLGKYII